MSTPLYFGRVENKQGNTVDYRLTMTHPDESRFGTDRVFAWKLLSDWVSPADDAADAEQAKKYVKRVTLSPLKDAKLDQKGSNWLSVKRVGKKSPSLVYTIEVTDPALLEGVKIGDEDEVYQFVENGPALDNEDTPPAGARRFTFSEGTSNKFWEVTVEGSAMQVRYGKLGTDGTTQTKTFGSPALAQKEADKLVGEKLKKGYQEVTATAVASVEAAPAAKAATAKTAPPAAWPVKTFDDFREETIALAAKSPSWKGQLPGELARWAASSTDEQLSRWLETAFPKSEDDGWYSRGAALVAVERAREKKTDSAMAFLNLAQKALPTEEWARNNAHQGLVPAWWRLGQATKAEAAFKELQQSNEAPSDLKLLELAARGGNTALVLEFVQKVRRWEDELEGELTATAADLFRDGDEKGFAALRAKWPESDSPSGLGLGLFEVAMARGTPEHLLEIVLTGGTALTEPGLAEGLLNAVERKDPRLAVTFAKRVLESDALYGVIKLMAVAVLATHAPADAKKWASANLARFTGLERFTWLAALQRHDEARGILAAVPESKPPYELVELATVTMDTELARDALKAYVTHPRFTTPAHTGGVAALPLLVDLGEQVLVDSILQKRLAAIEKQKPKDRDLDCRGLGAAAAMVGRGELSLKAWALPTPGVRYCTAGDSCAGAAKVGDWSAAFALLMKVDEDHRASCAVQQGLRAARAAQLNGPRAHVMRCVAFRGA